MTGHVAVRVPATTANLGPGFDTLGLALPLYNRLEVERIPAGLEIEIGGEGADRLPADETNLAYRAFRRIFEWHGRPVPPVRGIGEVQGPPARGVGRIAARVVAGLVVGSALYG